MMLTLVPLAGAIAAGNCVILKPSNVSPNVAQLIGQLLPRYLDPAIANVIGHTIEYVGDACSGGSYSQAVLTEEIAQ